MRFSAASLEMQRTSFAVRDAIQAVRGPRGAPPKASSASTHQNDGLSENFRNRADKSENFPLEGVYSCLKSRIFISLPKV